MMVGLTPRQLEVLHFIKGFIAANGFSPTYREIAKGIGSMSRGSTFATVQHLIVRGHLRRYQRDDAKCCMNRSLEVVDGGEGERRCEIVLPDTSDVAPAFRSLADLLGSASGRSPCQITITIREMPFAPTKEA